MPIILGFEDPDICLLNRTVPTPATEDVPMALQILASFKAQVSSLRVSGGNLLQPSSLSFKLEAEA